MCPPRHSSLCLLNDGGSSAEELRDEPEEEDDACGKCYPLPEANEGWNERINPVPGKEGKVGAKHSRDRAGCPEHGNIRSPEKWQFGSCSNNAGEEVEAKEW